MSFCSSISAFFLPFLFFVPGCRVGAFHVRGVNRGDVGVDVGVGIGGVVVVGTTLVLCVAAATHFSSPFASYVSSSVVRYFCLCYRFVPRFSTHPFS